MAQEMITSLQNPLVKRLGKLLERKGREEQGRFLVEGAHLVEEALKSGAEVVTVLYDPNREIDPACQRALAEREGGIQILTAAEHVLAKLSETRSPQGILAEVKKREEGHWKGWLQEQAADKEHLLVLMLDEIQDPGNLGTIIRTAEAAAVDALFLGKGSVDVYNGKVVRSTMGALFRLPVFSLSLPEAVREWKQLGGKLLAATLGDRSLSYDEADYAGKTAIVIGNEGRGVSPALVEMADAQVHIPIYGRAESLNAAIAAGILVYEARRQRTSRKLR